MINLSEEHESKNSIFFNNKYKEFGTETSALGWSPESQLTRFRYISSLVSFRNKTLLDVGSGFGDFLFYLIENGHDFKEYLGLEPMIPFYEKSIQRFRKVTKFNAKFVNSYHNKYSFTTKFDLVFCIGTFNLKVSDNYEFIINALRLLSYHGDRIYLSCLDVAANEVLKEVSPPDIFFYDINLLSNKLKRYFFVDVHNGYLPHDALIVLGRK